MRRFQASRVAAAVVAATTCLCLLPTSAAASSTQESIFEPGPQLLSNTGGTLEQLRELGVDRIRLFMHWESIAPAAGARTRPAHFNGTSPAAYPARNWAPWDAIIKGSEQYGIKIDLDLGGRAPFWAMPPDTKKTVQGSNDPDASEYAAFVQAVGKRYSGTYHGLPRVDFWSVWNEPDYISSLQPQGTGPDGTIPNSPHLYRDLVDAAWRGLRVSGHGRDSLLIGELANRGYTNFGPHSHGGMFPVTFVQSMYCVDSHYRELRGSTALAEGCPANASGSRRFRSQHPALFQATGFSDHPYSRWYPPDREEFAGCNTGLCTALAQIGNLSRALDKVQRVYGSNKRFPIYSTEYGYQTSPPKRSPDPTSHDFFVAPSTAAMYLNWAEYISYKNPRVVSYDQYLLYDPVKPSPDNDYGSFASGLITWNGQKKVTYDAFRLPLYMPVSTGVSGQSLEVWGDGRAASYAAQDTGLTQTVYIQFQPSGSSAWSDVQPVTITNPEGYFDVRVPFTESGNVRLAYVYPMNDPMLPDLPGTAVVSRSAAITVN